MFWTECVVMRSAESERAKREMKKKKRRTQKIKEKQIRRERVTAESECWYGCRCRGRRIEDALRHKMSRDNRRDTHNVAKEPMGSISYEGKHRCLAGSYGQVTNEVFQDSTGRHPTGKKIPWGDMLRDGKDSLEILLDWQDPLYSTYVRPRDSTGAMSVR